MTPKRILAFVAVVSALAPVYVRAETSPGATCQNGRPNVQMLQLRDFFSRSMTKEQARYPAGSSVFEYDTYLVDDMKNRTTEVFFPGTKFSCDAHAVYAMDPRSDKTTVFPFGVVITKQVGAGQRILAPGQQPDVALSREIREGDARFVKRL